jgi:peptidoglycan hydrolase CwlO-like protein
MENKYDVCTQEIDSLKKEKNNIQSELETIRLTISCLQNKQRELCKKGSRLTGPYMNFDQEKIHNLKCKKNDMLLNKYEQIERLYIEIILDFDKQVQEITNHLMNIK